MELTDGFGAVVENVKRDDRLPFGFTTSSPNLPGKLPRKITIVKLVAVTFCTCEPLNVPTFDPLLLKTSTVRPDWKLLPKT
jgi:hypothetical protein